MATTLYLIDTPGLRHRGDNTAKLNAAASWWQTELLQTTRGGDTTGLITKTVATVAGATNGVEVAGTNPMEWISFPLSADATISGTITLNLWAKESTTAGNAAINAVIEKIDGATGALTQIVKTARVTELTASIVAVNFTATPTSTACKKGDWIRVRVFADDAGTMAAGQTVTFYYSRASAAQGESFVTFTETLTFETLATPSGTLYYLNDAASTVNPGGNVEKTATQAGSSSAVTSVTNTAAGPTAPIQITSSAGGTPIEWYTPPLEATTIGGFAQMDMPSFASNAAADASLAAEIAIVNGDGSGAAVWGSTHLPALTSRGLAGELGTSASVESAYVCGDDTAISAGQRLRFRIYVDDCGSGPLVTGYTVTVRYNTTTVNGANVRLPITVIEQVAAATKKPRVVSSRVPVMRAALR